MIYETSITLIVQSPPPYVTNCYKPGIVPTHRNLTMQPLEPTHILTREAVRLGLLTGNRRHIKPLPSPVELWRLCGEITNQTYTGAQMLSNSETTSLVTCYRHLGNYLVGSLLSISNLAVRTLKKDQQRQRISSLPTAAQQALSPEDLFSYLYGMLEGLYECLNEKFLQGVPKECWDIYTKLRRHGFESIHKPDSFDRVNPYRFSALQMPNCLGFAVICLAVLAKLGFRHHLALVVAGEQECDRAILVGARQSMYTYMCKFSAIFSTKEIDEMRTKWGEALAEDTFQRMLHYCVLVELDRERNVWACLDPFQGVARYLDSGHCLTAVTDNLESVRSCHPGLCVPVMTDTRSFGSEVLYHRVRRNFHRRMRRWDISETDGISATHQDYLFAAIAKRATRVAQDDSQLEFFLSRYMIDSSLGASIVEQLARSPKKRGTDLTRLLRFVADEVSEIQYQNSPGHACLEICADSMAYLGMAAAHAATTAIRARLSPELLCMFTSQALWCDLGNSGITQSPDASSLLSVRNAQENARKHFGSLKPTMLHPVLRRYNGEK